MTDSLRGKLLVAAPMLVDPNFNRTVVLLLEHNDDGAIGLVLNRPSDVVLNDALSSWAELAPAPAVVFVGGPVSAESAIGLAEARSSTVETETDGFAPLLEGLGTVDLARPPDLVLPAVARVRVFAGYAGWASEQLEYELREEAWFVVDRLPQDLWSDDPAGMWRAVLRRQRGLVAHVANFPVDLRSN